MDYLSLIGAIPSLMSAFSGNTTAPYQKQQEAITGRNADLSAALRDTNNPLYQQLYGQYKQQNQSNLAGAIAEAQRQNRAASAMGRTPLFNAERGSENPFRQLALQAQNGGVQADQQTRQALTGALGGGNAALSGYNSITPTTVAANKMQNTGYQGIYDLIKGLRGGSGQQGNTSPIPGYSNNTSSAPATPNYNAFSY